MGILALLILVDILMMGLVMYMVFKEKPKEHATTHPLVVKMREADAQSRAQAAPPVEKTEDKAE
jgi:hypothetical protein